MHNFSSPLIKLLRQTSLRVCLVVVWLMVLCETGFAIETRESFDEELVLYLPVREQQFPELMQELKQYFEDSGLGALQIQTSDYWPDYQWALRNGKPGLYYAAPHFLAWSVHRHNFEPVVRIAEPLKYVIASRTGNHTIFEINDLNDKVVCAQRALNLDFLLINSAFDNRLHSAEAMPVWSVAEAMSDAASPCLAFSVSNHYFIEQERLNPGKFIRLQQGDAYNNFGFSLHPDLKDKYQDTLQRFLESPRVEKILQPLLKQSATKTGLIAAQASDYPKSYLTPLQTYWRE